MKKLNKKQNEKIGYKCMIVFAVFGMTLASVILFKNMNWINGAFFMFGIMFFMGYTLLTLVLKRMREGIISNV